ncbi:MAG: acyl-CoA/acyl-ACP dehydrogenase [Actinobacteria bacterium]|nr:acyl-CoA/acyl-ACP dehydrogenase [Actinomycetota bacterium]MBU2687753.1 acyl-CoA/acyl-ACP dehydrogenase [Actinomycetota bacterium]
MAREPRFEEIMCGLLQSGKVPRAMVSETREAVALARRFSDEVVRPHSLELDRRMQEDPTYIPWDFARDANRWGFYTMWLPRFLGGKGMSLPTMGPFFEELCACDSTLGLLTAGQYFGFSILLASWNLRIIQRIVRDVIEGERTGEPCILAGAVTEPQAGTDVEEMELLSRAKVNCHARKVKGGYLVNGTKIFISLAQMATWTMLIAYEDLHRPEETVVMLAVKKGTKGFSLGRMENKMGQKACPVGELIFEDCFIPDEDVCYSSEQVRHLRRGPKESAMQLIDFVVSNTRPGVGAAATGVARGAYEQALRFACETEVDGKLLVNHEWAQCLLAEMYKNVALARMTYMEGTYVNGLYGITRLLSIKPVYYLDKVIPESTPRWIAGLLDSDSATRWTRKFLLDGQTDEQIARTSGWASLSKFAASDLALDTCEKAIELMGHAGTRHEYRVEKHLRDIKVMQIFEGTNQLNRLNLFKCMIARSTQEALIFSD